MELVCSAVAHAAEAMSVQANKRHHEVEVKVGSFAWLSTEHLWLRLKLVPLHGFQPSTVV